MALPRLEVEVTADTKQAEAALDGLGRQVDIVSRRTAAAQGSAARMTGALGALGNISGQTRSKIQNASFQIQDIVVQLQSGTSATTALSQQLPQLASGFGAVGAIIGTGLGLAIPALAIAFSSLSEQTEDFEDALDSVSEAADRAEGLIELLRLGTDRLVETYGEGAMRVREFALAQAEIAAAQAAARLSDQVGLLDDLTDRYANLGRRGGVIQGLINIQRDFGDVTQDQARRIQNVFRELDRAVTFEQQQAALEVLIETLDDMEVNLADLPPELQRAISEMITFSNETDRARALVAQLAAEAQGVTVGVPLFAQGFDAQGLLPPEDLPDEPKARGGGRRRDPREAQLESLIEGLKTERELVEEFRSEGLELLASANEQELEVLGGFNEAKLRLEEEYQERLRRIKQMGADSDLSIALGAGAEVLSALGSFNDKALKIAKVAGAAQALVSTFQGQAEALKLPFPLNFAAAAAIAAKGFGLVAAIKGVSSSGGGTAASGAGGAAGAAAASQAPSPLDVRISGLTPDTIVQGASITGLFDRLQTEAGDRGLRFTFAS